MKKTTVVDLRRSGCDVIIDRSSRWGNPFTHIKDRKTFATHIVASRAEAIAKYEEWIKTQPELLAALPTLRGKSLGCWCAPFLCHGDVLARLADAVVEGANAEG